MVWRGKSRRCRWSHESGSLGRYHAVEHDLDQEHFGSGRAHIVRAVASPSYLEPRSVRLFNLLRPFGALELPVLYIFESVWGYLVFSNEVAGIGWVFDSPPYSLKQSAKLVARRICPDCPYRRLGQGDG